MDNFQTAFWLALHLIGGLDQELLNIIFLSVRVSLSATVIAAMIGAPAGLALALAHFPGQRGVIILCHAFLGLPPVTVGLFIYLLLSRSGPFAALGLLFTPSAMIIAQTVLAIPIITALVYRTASKAWSEYRDEFSIFGTSRWRIGCELLRMDFAALLTAFLTAFGRVISEVGAILVVGGNIRFHTRTMTTAIALETNKGDLGFALALGLALIVISLGVSTLAFGFNHLLAAER